MTVYSGQGNRVKESCGDEVCEEFVVPGGDLAPQTHGVFGGGPSHEIVGHVLDGGAIGGGVVRPDAAFVVAEDHVQHPVQAVFDHPMTADHRSDVVGQQDQRGD